jgi:ABC-type antimicrobial peptide transport system permease subunit
MTGYEMVELQGISALLYWMYVIMGLAGLVTLIFSVFYFVIHWKNRKKKSWKALTFTGSLGVLLLVAYLIGNGIPLSIIGYTGSENTYLWLKLTDMWIYSLYVLLVLTFLAVIGGILWSLLKK